MKANRKRLIKIADLAIPMFILAIPFYMYNKIRGKV